jgi:uncharacterized membrane protein
MPEGYVNLLLAAAVFVGLHIVPSSPGLRRPLARGLGERGYLGLFSVASLAGFVWLIWAYTAVPTGEPLLWHSNAVLRGVAAVLVAIGFILLVAAYSSINPTAIGSDKALKSPDPARGMIRVTRHPLMWGITLWTVAHLLNRNDLGGLLLFGSLGILAIAGTVLIDRKKAVFLEDDWGRFVALTSNVPFLAIIQGRNRLDLAEIGWWRIVLGLVVFAVFYGYGHMWLFGVSPHP